jgi:hypothetical protein
MRVDSVEISWDLEIEKKMKGLTQTIKETWNKRKKKKKKACQEDLSNKI